MPEDAVARADVADYYGGRHVDDAYNDARYGTHDYDAEPADEALRADEVVRADVVVPVRMHRFLITGRYMRIVVFSFFTLCKSHSSMIND